MDKKTEAFLRQMDESVALFKKSFVDLKSLMEESRQDEEFSPEEKAELDKLWDEAPPSQAKDSG